MARIRSIKPEFWESESNGSISRDARLLFIGLFNVADDEGRFRAAPKFLAGRLFAYDRDAADLIGGWINELADAGKVRIYELDGETFGFIPNFAKHQKIDKPSPSKFPEPPEDSTNPREDSRILAKNSPGTGNREQGGEQGTGRAQAPRAPRVAFAVPDDDFPESLRSPEFVTVWRDFERHRREIRKPLTPTAARGALAEMAGLGQARAGAAIRHTIAKGWQGIREPGSGFGDRPPFRSPAADLAERDLSPAAFGKVGAQ